MANLNKIISLVFVWIVNYTVGKSSQKLLITVMYESSSPSSRSFLLLQLLPAMQLLHEHVRMRLVPFGTASSIDYGFGGFECSKGYLECMENMKEDCTLEVMHLNGHSDFDKVKYVACEIGRNSSPQNYQCIEEAKVKPEYVQDCIQNGRGTVLQLYSEYQTSLVGAKSFPVLVFNNEFSTPMEVSGKENLMGTLCHFLSKTKPCLQHFNRLALNTILNGSTIM